MSASVSMATPSRPTSPIALRMVGVVAHQRRHVEVDGEPGLPLRDQVLEALVGVLAGAEARDLAHRPEAAAVHRRIRAAREREAAGQADVLGRRVGDVRRRVDALHRHAASRCEVGTRLRLAREELGELLGLPVGLLARPGASSASGSNMSGSFVARSRGEDRARVPPSVRSRGRRARRQRSTARRRGAQVVLAQRRTGAAATPRAPGGRGRSRRRSPRAPRAASTASSEASEPASEIARRLLDARRWCPSPGRRAYARSRRLSMLRSSAGDAGRRRRGRSLAAPTWMSAISSMPALIAWIVVAEARRRDTTTVASSATVQVISTSSPTSDGRRR